MIRISSFSTVLFAAVLGAGCGGYDGAANPRAPHQGYGASPVGEPRAPGSVPVEADGPTSPDESRQAEKPRDIFAKDDREGVVDSPKKAQEPARATPAGSGVRSGTAGSASQAPATSQAPRQDNRDFVVYTARFTMAVYQVEQGLSAVEKIARDNGGYLGQRKDREITVRVPRGRFDPTLAAIDKIGDVLHRDIAADDVTDQHVDLEIRIKNARAMQRRLTELLGRADVKNALEIEKELHRVTEELERLEGHLKVLNDKVAYSTVTVAFEPRGTTIQTARVKLPFVWLGAMNLPSLLTLSEDK